MSTRKHRSTKVRTRIFEAHGRKCHVCGAEIQPGEGWDLDHVIPLALYGEDEEHNLAPAHRKGCHSEKTAKQDVPAISQALRREARYLGTRAPKRKIQTAGFEPPAPQCSATRPVPKLAITYQRDR